MAQTIIQRHVDPELPDDAVTVTIEQVPLDTLVLFRGQACMYTHRYHKAAPRVEAEPVLTLLRLDGERVSGFRNQEVQLLDPADLDRDPTEVTLEFLEARDAERLAAEERMLNAPRPKLKPVEFDMRPFWFAVVLTVVATVTAPFALSWQKLDVVHLVFGMAMVALNVGALSAVLAAYNGLKGLPWLTGAVAFLWTCAAVGG